MSVACVVIASERRRDILDNIIVPSTLGRFSEVVVVGDYHEGSGYRYLPLPVLTGTTVDALVKRDVGTLATDAPWLLYLSDDHAVRATWTPPDDPMVITVPRRFCTGHELNMGMDPTDPNAPYCGGHGGLFSRKLVQMRPWSTMPHHRLWDLLSSREYMAMGARLVASPRWAIEDVEGGMPWL